VNSIALYRLVDDILWHNWGGFEAFPPHDAVGGCDIGKNPFIVSLLWPACFDFGSWFEGIFAVLERITIHHHSEALPFSLMARYSVYFCLLILDVGWK
jgi:hypothetical protein